MAPGDLKYWSNRGFYYDEEDQCYYNDGWTIEEWEVYRNNEADEGTAWDWDIQGYAPIVPQQPSVFPEAGPSNPAPNPEPKPKPKQRMDEKKTPKLAPPMVFDGDKRKSKLFLQQLKVYITIKEEQFSSELQKVAFALSFMQKGEAARFAETWYAVEHESKELLGTWTEFEMAFKAQFFAKTTKRAAFDRLVTLKQTGGVDAYISIFRKLIAEAEISDDTILINFFRKGLKHDIAMEINRKDTLPTRLVDYMEAALEMEARRASVYGGGQSQSKRRDPYAMDIDKVDAEGEEATAESSARQLSAGEKDRRRRLGLCFKCGQKGLSRDCPNHPKAQAWKPGSKPSTSARAATTTPVAGPSARKIEVDESVLNRLLAMEEKFNKLTEKDF